MPMRRPRIRRIASGRRLSMRSPFSRISPPAMRPGGSISPITAVPVIDLPAPDSPTTPSTSPGAMSKDTPSIAVKRPRRLRNWTLRSRTLRVGSVIPSPQLRVEGVAQPVAQQVDRQGQDRQGQAREDGDPPFAGEQEAVADADQRAQ